MSVEVVEVDAVGDDVDFAVFLVGDGFGVDVGDDGEGIEDGEGLVLGGAEHLELVMKEVAPEAVGLFHSTLCIHGEGILEVHDFGERQSGDEGHGADHLVVDHIGLHLAGESLAGALGMLGVPVAHLERFGGETVAEGIEVAGEAVEADDANLAAVGLEDLDVFGEDALVADGEEVDVVVLGELDNLVIGAELVTFLEGPRETGEDDQNLHNA